MRVTSHLIASAASLGGVLLMLGCITEIHRSRDDGSTSTGGGGDASTSSTTDATTATTTDASSSSGAMGEPCKPLKNADDPHPTPGACDANVATTCGQDGFLAHDACDASETCVEYTLHEKVFNADPNDPAWVDGRDVKWAACLPADAEKCPTAWNGNYYWAVDPPLCDAANRVQCRNVPAPELFSNSPQMIWGNEEGWLQVLPCGPNEKCAGGDTVGELACIDAATPDCDGTEPKCSGNGIEYCAGTWLSTPGYKDVEPCNGGNVCYTGTGGPFCEQPGETPCDDATTPATCSATADAVITCYQGWTHHQSCATCFGPTGGMVPCRCEEETATNGWWSSSGGSITCQESTGFTCVPKTVVDCDPATDADTCVGNVAHRCIGYWEDFDCASQGKICGVGDGVAGCRDPNAQPCSPIGTQSECQSGTEILGCCACGRIPTGFAPAQTLPCVSGFTGVLDCADLGAPYECKETNPPFGFAECVFNP
ncbi:MAG: hypothetical protein U0414_44335 [Polyangiaceae bacterium]